MPKKKEKQEEVKLTDIQKAEMEKAFELSKVEYEANIKNAIRAEKNKEINSLISVLKEYANNFVLIGYDLNGMPIELISLGSPEGQDALVERIRRLTHKINHNINESMGNNPFGVGNGQNEEED